MTRNLQQALSESYDAHRDAVWGACYRLTGTVHDADELTQETYLRLRERPPERLDESLRNWLLTVAANLCRDRLRRRKNTDYLGQWLPAPVDFDETSSWFVNEGRSLEQQSPEQRLERLHSASYAFLLALEKLTPNQRSVLLLRDVYELSVRETAEALELSESNVKTTHHRARKRLDGADELSRPDTVRQATRQVLGEFMRCLAQGDTERLEELFRDDVRLLSDGGDGEYTAATRPVTGRRAVLAMLRGLAAQSNETGVQWVTLNGLPALLVEFDPPTKRHAARAVVRLEVDSARRVRELHVLLGSSKIGHLGR